MLLVFSLSFNCRLTREGEESEMSENNLEHSSTIACIFIQNYPLHLEDCINKFYLILKITKPPCQIIYFGILNIIFMSILMLTIIKNYFETFISVFIMYILHYTNSNFLNSVQIL